MQFPVILWNQNPLAMKRMAFILAILMFPAVLTCQAQSQSPQKALKTVQKENKGVNLLWTAEDRDVFTESIVPYAHKHLDGKSENGLTLIIWGPAVKVLAENDQTQDKLASMIDKGLHVKTSEFLTDQYGVTEQMKQIGVEVGKTDEVLTKTLTEEGSHIVSL